jgi:cytoskeletal protein RodZ
MFLASFALLFESNLRDNGWSESKRKKITALASLLAFMVFSGFLILYIWKRYHEKSEQTEDPQLNQNVS